MGDNWKPGDLALCLRDGEIYDCPCGAIHGGTNCPPRGSVRVVKSLDHDGDGCELLVVSGAAGAALSARFRKVTPDEADEFDRETIALMNGTPAPPAPSKPVEVGNV